MSWGTGHEWLVKAAGEQEGSSDPFPKAFIPKWRVLVTVFITSLLPYFSIWGTKQKWLFPAPL